MDKKNENKARRDAMVEMAMKELEQIKVFKGLKKVGTLEFHNKSHEPPKLTEEEVRRQILESTLNRANAIYQANEESEKSKGKWRIFFIIFCCVLLLLTLIFVFVMVALNSLGVVTIEKEVIIALLTYIVANFFTILVFMVKYVHNSQYLETFKTVTYKLLDYVLADKNAKGAILETKEDIIIEEKKDSGKPDENPNNISD